MEKLNINFKTGSRPLSIAAGLLAIGGLLSCFKADNNSKPLAINITVAAIATVITNEALSRHYAATTDHQFEKAVQTFGFELNRLKGEVSHKNNKLVELKSLYDTRKEELQTTKADLEANKVAIKVLQDKLTAINKSFDLSQKELAAKLAADDNRFKESITQFRDMLIELLQQRVCRHFDDLDRAIQAKLNCSFPINVKNQLQLLSSKLDSYFERHNELIDEIKLEYKSSEIFNSIAIKYSSIHDEIVSLKVQFRKILNIETQLNLDKAYELLGQYKDGFVPKAVAVGSVQEISKSYIQDLEKLGSRATENDNELGGWKQQVDNLLNEIEEKNLIIADLKKPLRWGVATRDDLRIGNGIIAYFEPLVLDRAYSDYQKHQATLYFHVDRNQRTIIPSELNEHSEKLMQLLHTLSPVKFDWDAEQGLMKSTIQIASRPKAEKQNLDSAIPTCKSLVEKSKRGFLITGHPGAGKSSAIKAISQWLGNDKSMRLALNPHTDDLNTFTDSGFVELNKLEEIYEAINQLDTELKLRGEDKTRRNTLIIAIDELGRLLQDAPKELDVMEIIKLAAVEGRKFNVIVLVGNHSQTTAAIEMDGQFRESFYQLFLVGAARYKLNQPKPPSLKEHETSWIESAPYPVLASINAKFEACQHPTHYPYKDFQDSGYPPVGLATLSQNAVVIGSKNYGLDPKQCPKCGSTSTENKGNGRRKCKDCNHNYLVD